MLNYNSIGVNTRLVSRLAVVWCKKLDMMAMHPQCTDLSVPCSKCTRLCKLQNRYIFYLGTF